MNTSALIQKVWNFCGTLGDAFAAQLLRQGANEEPASVLLARLRAKRDDVKARTAPRGRTAKEAA